MRCLFKRVPMLFPGIGGPEMLGLSKKRLHSGQGRNGHSKLFTHAARRILNRPPGPQAQAAEGGAVERGAEEAGDEPRDSCTGCWSPRGFFQQVLAVLALAAHDMSHDDITLSVKPTRIASTGLCSNVLLCQPGEVRRRRRNPFSSQRSDSISGFSWDARTAPALEGRSHGATSRGGTGQDEDGRRGRCDGDGAHQGLAQEMLGLGGSVPKSPSRRARRASKLGLADSATWNGGACVFGWRQVSGDISLRAAFLSAAVALARLSQAWRVVSQDLLQMKL